MKTKISYDRALEIAGSVVAILQPYCDRIAIAGSVRRQRPEVGDIEIVATPREFLPDLLGAPTENHSLDVFPWESIGELKTNGHKQKKVILSDGIQLDLFIVTPPAQWGVIYLLRTGNDKFSHRFVTAKSFGGFMPGCYRMKDGAIWHGTKVLETPEEADLFKLWGMRYVPPVERQLE